MIVYTCEDTFEAMMTCIYDAWASKEGHQNIRLKTEPLGTMELFCEYRTVTSDPVKARKVVRSIQQKISSTAYLMVYRCALSDHPDKLDRIYRFLLLGFAYPAQLTDMLQHPYVNAVFELNRKVMNPGMCALSGTSGQCTAGSYKTKIRYSDTTLSSVR